jgi:hypothetical protein
MVFDLAIENRNHLLNDYDNDIVIIIGGYERLDAAGALHGFVAYDYEQPVGVFWIEVDRGVGRIRGALFDEFRTLWNAVYFLKRMTVYAFEELNIRKLDAEFPLYSKKDKNYAVAEQILKRIGFKKRAILPENMMIDGKPKDTILLDYLRKDYDERP